MQHEIHSQLNSTTKKPLKQIKMGNQTCSTPTIPQKSDTQPNLFSFGELANRNQSQSDPNITFDYIQSQKDNLILQEYLEKHHPDVLQLVTH